MTVGAEHNINSQLIFVGMYIIFLVSLSICVENLKMMFFCFVLGFCIYINKSFFFYFTK